MSRSNFVWLLVTLTLTATSYAHAQPATKMFKIGFLASASEERVSGRLAAFKQGLQELGFVEGKNITIMQRSAAGQFDKLSDLAAELLRLGVDILVAEGAPAAHAAKNATRAIPIVFGNAADPVGTGLVASLAQPGGNITGLSELSGDLITKRLEILKEVVPSATRIAVLLNPTNPTNPLQLKEIRTASSVLGVTPLPFEAKDPNDFDRAFETFKRERAGALIVIGDPMFGSHRRQLADLAIKNRLPAMYTTCSNVELGGLMCYAADVAEQYRRAATYVDKILKGDKAGELPVEQPKKFDFFINLKAAKQIGVTIPPNVLVRANRVIR